MPNKPRRGPRFARETRLTSPLPHSPSPCAADAAAEWLLCSVNDINHLQQQQHQQNVLDYLRLEWSVIRPELFLQRHGVAALNQAAQDLADMLDQDDMSHISRRGAFAAWHIKQTAQLLAQAQPHLRIVSDEESAQGGVA